MRGYKNGNEVGERVEEAPGGDAISHEQLI